MNPARLFLMPIPPPPQTMNTSPAGHARPYRGIPYLNVFFAIVVSRGGDGLGTRLRNATVEAPLVRGMHCFVHHVSMKEPQNPI